ncbi:MAG: ATP-grasp domain-containing protein [Candidatus Peribacteraceae bacterium]|nr:ATP-grasp domain-containing protein [Candidatus Peribacteraceae bacterium]
MLNVLITCAGGAGSQYLAESVRNTYNIFLADGNDEIVAAHSDLPFQKIPLGSDPAYKASITTLVKKLKIDFIVPGADEELIPLAILHEESVVKCVMPIKHFVEACLHKKKLMHLLHQHGLSTLLPFATEDEVVFPAVAKPIFGRGSYQAHRIDTKHQLEGYLKLYSKTFPEILVQPCIDGQEYTVSVILNNMNKLIGIVPKRIIRKKGITQVAVTENNACIEEVCKKIVETMNPCGPFNVQLMLLKNTCYIFEINPRLSTTAVLTDKAFGNEIDLFIRHYDHDRIFPLPAMRERVYLYRGTQNFFVDAANI